MSSKSFQNCCRAAACDSDERGGVCPAVRALSGTSCGEGDGVGRGGERAQGPVTEEGPKVCRFRIGNFSVDLSGEYHIRVVWCVILTIVYTITSRRSRAVKELP